jgi:hypothetical protein
VLAQTVLAQTWRNQLELRFDVDREAARRVLDELGRRLPQLRYQPSADRTFVVTTYLDTPERHYLRLAEQDDGTHSLKMRVREYLWHDGSDPALNHDSICYLERKQRAGDIRLKQRVSLAKAEVGAIVRRQQPLVGESAEAQALRDELSAHALAPVMISAYERRVFGEEDGLRVTFDERIGFYRPIAAFYDETPAFDDGALGQPMGRGPSRILEVKHPSEIATPSWLAELIAGLPAAAGYSKFRDGMHALARSDGRPVNLTRRMEPVKLP